MKLKFKKKPKKKRPVKRKRPVKLSFFNPAAYHPKRSKRDWKLIDRNPFGDKDGDRVPNIFDCKPLNKNKQGKNLITLYHGTSNTIAKKIRREGFKPEKSMVGRVHFSPHKSSSDPLGDMEAADEHGTKILKVKLPISMAHFEFTGQHSVDSDYLFPDIDIEQYKKLSGKRIMTKNKRFQSPKEEYMDSIITSDEDIPKEYLAENYPQKEAPETLQSLKDELKEDL